MKKKTILVICRGNIARSPFAEVTINREIKRRKLDTKYIAISRGVQGTSADPKPVRFSNIIYYKTIYSEAAPALNKLGVDITSHVSTPIDRNIAEESNVILAMDKKTRTALLFLFPDLRNKIHLFSELIGSKEDFTDPESLSGKERHLKIFSAIQEAVIKGFPKLLNLVK